MARDGIATEIETIPINQVKDAFEGVICSDMRLATWRRSSGGGNGIWLGIDRMP